MAVGYEPYLVRALLGLSNGRFRYWRKELDPNPNRSHFSSSDILAYRVLKKIIDVKILSVKVLSRFDWAEIFTLFSMKKIQELKGMAVTIDFDSAEVTLLRLDDIPENMSNIMMTVYLEDLISEHIKAFIKLGHDAGAGNTE